MQKHNTSGSSGVKNGIIEIEISQAPSLLALLMPWNNIVDHNTIFRGQGDSNWSLEPTIYREFNSDKDEEQFLPLSPRDQIDQERLLLEQFLNSCNLQGLPIPGGYEQVQRMLRLATFEDPLRGFDWPPAELLPFITLAQHSGLSTRLLDWSKNPFVATFFAVSQHLERRENNYCKKVSPCSSTQQPSTLVLWLCKTNRLGATQNTQSRSPIHISIPEYFSNPNLRAQEGVMMFNKVLHSNQIGILDPFDMQLDRWFLRQELPPEIQFIKFLVPTIEVYKLLVLLEDLGISATKLFPGYRGAADDAKFKSSDLHIEGRGFNSAGAPVQKIDEEVGQIRTYILDQERLLRNS